MPKRRTGATAGSDEACPCGSGAALRRCCGPYLSGERDAPTAEALMRARYSANVRRDRDFLVRTWHPDTLPDRVTDTSVAWLGLEVRSSEGGQALDRVGTVRYRARYRRNGVVGAVAEQGHFARVGARWVYVTGDAEAI